MKQAAFVARALGCLADCGASYYFLNQVAVFINVDMGFMWSAEEIVIVSHHLLICANQKKRQVIGFTGNK